MGTIVEKEVTMGADEWRDRAAQARTLAVRYINDDAMLEPGGVSRGLIGAADLLRAAKTFEGHANMLEMFGGEDAAQVDVWDLSDEDDTPAWPDVSTELRATLGDNPKALQMIDHIDRLHDLAIEKGLPVITKGALVSEIAGSA